MNLESEESHGVSLLSDSSYSSSDLSDQLMHRETTTLEHRPVIEQASNQKLLTISIFAEVYLVDDKTIRKAPRSHSEDDMESIIREATIYKMIDSALPREGQIFFDIKYDLKYDLSNFCLKNEVSTKLQSKWFRQLIEAVEVIHRYRVIHLDPTLRQFFIDKELNIY
ncbi:uncharacterized protein N7525_007212 [Penicillium rubens]|uniref:uncharacterized protein n=1 Tax=Penicillium rubens TaxID=1108849 RepID=UPI002A5A6871|nr:uncharacterized protein N7525_007212 [Penicillium rubens]KAJ5828959.1 hypothetical protein N7525_007212 [Penicillium rubens]KAJ5841341.1 hypothetical protein N7534_011171 [Penicillium rubens]